MGKPFPVIDMAATGKNILRLRKARGLSVTDVQRFFGFEAPQAVYKWQKGQCLPSVDNLIALSDLLEVPLDKLLVREEPRSRYLPQDKTCGSPFFGFSRHASSRLAIIFSQNAS